jgi:hypothetical protein
VTSTASVAGAGDNPQKIVPVHMKKRKKTVRRFFVDLLKIEIRTKQRCVRESWRNIAVRLTQNRVNIES